MSQEGYWGEECTEPLTTLSEAGVEVTVATPGGDPPVIDERSVDPNNVGAETAERVVEIHEADERLRNPVALADATPEAYDAVVFPGGHGTEWGINQDRHARAALRTAVEGEAGTALVVCRAVGILAFTRGSDGDFLVADRSVTGFPNAWEEGIVDDRSVTGFPNAWEEGIVDERDLMPDGRKLPYWVEDEVRAAGADWDAELDADTSVTVDGDLITARGPPSSHEAAVTLRNELGIDS